MRDSVALLDQLATFGSGKVEEQEAIRLLGGLDLQLYNRLLRSILDGDSAAVSSTLREVEEQGWDPRRTHGQFLAYCRSALHAAVGADTSQLDLPDDDADQLEELAREVGYENVLRLLNQLLKSEELVRRSDSPALAVEVAWLRAAELPKLVGIEEILAGGGGLEIGGQAPKPRRQPPKRPPRETEPRRAAPRPAASPPDQEPAEVAPDGPPPEAAGTGPGTLQRSEAGLSRDRESREAASRGTPQEVRGSPVRKRPSRGDGTR